MVVLCGSGGGMRKCMWAPEQNLSKFGRKTGRWMEVMLPGAGCPGSGSVDELDELRVERSNLGQNSGEFVDGNCGKGREKLDQPTTHEIRGSNPTKLHHTNESQKKIGAIFELGRKTTKSS